MDKIIRGKLELPPYLTPDARDLVKKVGSLLHSVLPRLLSQALQVCLNPPGSGLLDPPHPADTHTKHCMFGERALAMGSETSAVMQTSCQPWTSLCSCVLSRFGHVQLFATPWTVACQAPLSVGFSRQEHWSGLPCPSPNQ